VLHVHSITARFSLRPYDFVISHPFWNICHVTSRKLRLTQCIMGDDLHINKQTNIFIANHRRLLRQKEIIQNVLERKDSMAVLPTGFGKSMCYVPPFWTRFVLQNTLKCVVFHVIWMLFTYANDAQIIWHAELSSSHHAMHYCYHSVSIARSRL
jgi:hypothetical protein